MNFIQSFVVLPSAYNKDPGETTLIDAGTLNGFEVPNSPILKLYENLYNQPFCDLFNRFYTYFHN